MPATLKEVKLDIMSNLVRFMGEIPAETVDFKTKLADLDAYKTTSIFNSVLSAILDETCDIYSLHTSDSIKKFSVPVASEIGQYLHDSLDGTSDSDKIHQAKFMLCLTMARVIFNSSVDNCEIFKSVLVWTERAEADIGSEQNASHLSNLAYLMFLSLRNKNIAWQRNILEKSVGILKAFVVKYLDLWRTFIERSEALVTIVDTDKATDIVKTLLNLYSKISIQSDFTSALKKLLWKYLRNHYYKTRQDVTFGSQFSGDMLIAQVILETEIDVLDYLKNEEYNNLICKNICALLKMTNGLSLNRIPVIFKCFTQNQTDELTDLQLVSDPVVLFWHGIIRFAARNELGFETLQKSFTAFKALKSLQEKHYIYIELLSDIFCIAGRLDYHQEALELLCGANLTSNQATRVWSKYAMFSCRKGYSMQYIPKKPNKKTNVLSGLVDSYCHCLSFNIESSEREFSKHTSIPINDTFTCALACFVRANISKYWGIIGAAIIEALHAIKLLNNFVKTFDDSIVKSLQKLSLDENDKVGTTDYYFDGFMNIYLQLDLHLMLACLLDVRGSVKDAIYMTDRGFELANQFQAIIFTEAFETLKSCLKMRSGAQKDLDASISTFIMKSETPVYMKSLLLSSVPQHSVLDFRIDSDAKSGNLFFVLSSVFSGNSALEANLSDQCFFPEYINCEMKCFVENARETLDSLKSVVDHLQIDSLESKRLKSAIAKPSATVLKHLQEDILKLSDLTYLSSSPRRYMQMCNSMVCVEMLKKKIAFEKVFFWTESSKNLTVRREIMAGLLKKYRIEKENPKSRLPSFNYSVRPKEELPNELQRHIYELYANEYQITAQDMISSYLSDLPSSWCVISLNLIEDYNQFVRLIYSKHLVVESLFKFSLVEHDEICSLMADFKNIVGDANSITHSGKLCETKQDKLKWWEKRKTLDKNMRTCLSKLDELIFGDKFDASQYEHIVLVLDNHTQHITWECMPSLRKFSVSRIPCLSLLRDRLYLLQNCNMYGHHASNNNLEVKHAKTTYLLNPDGDLINTEQDMKPHLEQFNDGICARRPGKDEMKYLISNRHLFLYFGHSGAEQYISGKEVRELDKCGSILLFGCSSAALKQCGEYDCYGTALDYLIAGAPCVLGNLWDVTDKDLDKLTKSTLTHFGMFQDETESAVSDQNITKSLAASRDVCKLPYLTGAASVVYGIPIIASDKNKLL